MTTITEPRIIEDGRHLRAEWEIDTHEDEHGDAVTELAVLTVFHYGSVDYGPARYSYTATLDRQQLIDNGEYKRRRQTIGVTYRSSVDVGAREARRYSAKQAREFFDESLDEVVRRHDARDPDVLTVFGEDS